MLKAGVERPAEKRRQNIAVFIRVGSGSDMHCLKGMTTRAPEQKATRFSILLEARTKGSDFVMYKDTQGLGQEQRPCITRLRFDEVMPRIWRLPSSHTV